MFAAFPLLALPVLLYNLVLLTFPGGLKASDAAAQLAAPMFSVPMPSAGAWPISLGDLFIAGALVVLFIELLKSTNSRNVAIINHSLSMLLFVACLVEFLLLRGFSTSVFFLMTLMVLLDVLAGFVVTIVSARRDVEID